MEKNSNQQSDYHKAYFYRRIVQAKLFIDKHYAEAIDVDNIADEACFSKFHFIRSFASIYGRTPHQYLSYIRIEKACELLKQSKTVTEACFKVGFESVGSFSTLFKKYTGQSPALYQSTQLAIAMNTKEQPFSYIPGCYSEKFGWKENSNFEEAAV